ncbi:hypothetical protein MBRA_00977 [Methylobacterium brachiatum]|jgi:hypothetical protein|nr:hypothetical protein MBRA_00977 [Methylobacterium brachiatum]
MSAATHLFATVKHQTLPVLSENSDSKGHEFSLAW